MTDEEIDNIAYHLCASITDRGDPYAIDVGEAARALRQVRDATARDLIATLRKASELAETLGDAEPEHIWSCRECDLLGELRTVLLDAVSPAEGDT